MGEKRGRKYPSRPLVGVGAAVFRNNSVLLIRRGKEPRAGQWSLPGGAQKLGETVFAAACREVKEEAGIDVRVVGLLDVVDSISRDAEGGVDYHYTLVDVAAEWLSGELAAGGDAVEAVWVERRALTQYDLWSETTRIIDLAFDQYRTHSG